MRFHELLVCGLVAFGCIVSAGVAGAVDADPSIGAVNIDREIIYVIKRDDDKVDKAERGSSPASSEAKRKKGDIYDTFWNDPDQFYVDSPRGPMPLWGADIVYDAQGHPVPRYPDPITKRLMENPDDVEAYADYFAWRQVLMRRARITGERLPKMAAEMGVIGPETLTIPTSGSNFSQALGVSSGVDPKTLGTPALTAQQAHDAGLRPEEIPMTPGQPNDIEVFWFWDPACAFSEKMARDWFYFARDVTVAGYKAVAVTNSPDTRNGYGLTEYWAIKWPVHESSQIYDLTKLMDAMRIKVTPTTVFIDRRKGRMNRFEGVITEEKMRGIFSGILGGDGSWPPDPNPAAQAKQAGLKMERELQQIEADQHRQQLREDPERGVSILPDSGGSLPPSGGANEATPVTHREEKEGSK